MFGYIFEVTNTKTGEIYFGKKYSVTFDKNYLGEDENEKLAVAVEKYGKPAFEVKMLMPYESQEAVDYAFSQMLVPQKSTKKVVTKGTPDVAKDDVMVATEEKVVEEKPARKKKSAKTEG